MAKAPLLCLLALASAAQAQARLVGGADADGLLVAPAKPRGFLKCKVCEEAVHKAEKLLESKDVQAKVTKAIEEIVCPKTKNPDKCVKMAAAGVPAAAQWVKTHLPPKKACAKVGICSKATAEAVSATLGGTNETCSFCEAAVGFIDQKFVQNKTSDEVVQEMKNGCDKVKDLNENLGAQCEKYVDEYGAKIAFVLTTLGPDQLCALVHACSSDETEVADLTHPVVSPFLANGELAAEAMRVVEAHPTYITGEEPAATNGGECGECKFVVTQLKNVLSSNSTQTKVLDVVGKLCEDLPGAIASECSALVQQYGPMVLSTVANDLDPEADCKKIGACTSSSAVPRDVLVLPTAA